MPQKGKPERSASSAMAAGLGLLTGIRSFNSLCLACLHAWRLGSEEGPHSALSHYACVRVRRRTLSLSLSLSPSAPWGSSQQCQALCHYVISAAAWSLG